MHQNLRSFLTTLKNEQELCEISTPVSPDLELAEIHRRVVAQGGKALLFSKVKGSPYPVVTNLFGTRKRIDLAFSAKLSKLFQTLPVLAQQAPKAPLNTLWQKRSEIGQLLHARLKTVRSGPILEEQFSPPQLKRLPLLTCWPLDGGPFITLPLVYTEDPETGIHNLGMYRIQRFNDSECGFHAQIGKGAGAHLAKARTAGHDLPALIALGGPPALMLAAIAPLPENVPELLFAALAQEHPMARVKSAHHPLPIPAEAEFCLAGQVSAKQTRLEGPFGDHYGFYSLAHQYPLFTCERLFARKDAIFPATVVGKPRQEDYYLGEYLQELFSPLFPLVMPTVSDLWTYAETGFHSLAACRVKERYKREAMVSAFRVLGEGQLGLSKFLLVTDAAVSLRDFRKLFAAVLARADFRTDLYIFSNVAMDTLDYNGPQVNEGSKGVLLGLGEEKFPLTESIPAMLPHSVRDAHFFCPGCLVISAPSYKTEPHFAALIAESINDGGIRCVVLADDANKLRTSEGFLWQTFTRFNPATHITAKNESVFHHHISYTAPIVIDARNKPGFPLEVEVDEETEALVDKRWKEYEI